MKNTAMVGYTLVDAGLQPHSVSEAAQVRPQTPIVRSTNGHQRNKAGLAVTATIDDLVPGDIVALFKNGVIVDYSGVDGTQAHFYDLDDGVYIASLTKGAGTWQVEVIAATVTVTVITPGGAGSGEPIYAFA